MLHLALFLVVLHGVETVAQAVAALVERGAGLMILDEAEALLLEGFPDGARRAASRGTWSSVRRSTAPGGFDQVRQVEDAGSQAP